MRVKNSVTCVMGGWEKRQQKIHEAEINVVACAGIVVGMRQSGCCIDKHLDALEAAFNRYDASIDESIAFSRRERLRQATGQHADETGSSSEGGSHE